MKLLMTGGSGLLGTELRKLDPSLIAPAREALDITDRASVEACLERERPDTILHCAAATKPPEHERDPELGIRVNILGTANIARACASYGIRLVYTSTDYVYAGTGPHREDEPVFAPSNFVRSKLGAEYAVALVPHHLILRLSFGPVPFPWEKVYEGQYNSKLYVDEIAPLVLSLARGGEEGIMNVGGPRTSLFEYALRSRPDISTIPKPQWVPKDTSLDISKMKQALGIADEKSLLKR
jgi:dTDP-4-dehydrorhamnose reductase